MQKHLLEHVDMKKGQCLECDWVSGKKFFRSRGYKLHSSLSRKSALTKTVLGLMAEKDKNPSPKLAAQIFADVGKHLETHMVKSDNLDSEKIIERNWF